MENDPLLTEDQERAIALYHESNDAGTALAIVGMVIICVIGSIYFWPQISQFFRALF